MKKHITMISGPGMIPFTKQRTINTETNMAEITTTGVRKETDAGFASSFDTFSPSVVFSLNASLRFGFKIFLIGARKTDAKIKKTRLLYQRNVSAFKTRS
jgi:hypothetical protein